MSKRHFTPEQDKIIADRYLAGESSEAIAKDILPGEHVDGVTIRNTLRRLGIELRKAAHEMNPVVTAEQKQTAIDLCSQGLTLQEAANRVGVHKNTVFKATRGLGVTLPPGKQHTRKIDDHAFDVLTPESLYWLGFLFADGCVHQEVIKTPPKTRRTAGSPRLIVGLSIVDREHLMKLRTFLKSTHAITNRPPHDSKPTYKGGPDVKTGPSVYFSVRSKIIASTLTTRGIVTKGARVPTPELATSKDFWRGMIDGDGTIGIDSQQQKYAYPTVTLAGQLPLLNAFRDFLQANQLPALNPYPADSVWAIGTTGSTVKDIVRLLFTDVDAHIVLERKARRAICILHGCQVLSSQNINCEKCSH